MEGGEEVKCYCLEGDSFSFFCLLAPLNSASDPLGLCLNKKLPSVICFCLRFDGLRVRNSRHGTSSEMLCLENLFVNQIVHDPKRSRTEV